jgi:hypothetical protein
MEGGGEQAVEMSWPPWVQSVVRNKADALALRGTLFCNPDLFQMTMPWKAHCQTRMSLLLLQKSD